MPGQWLLGPPEPSSEEGSGEPPMGLPMDETARATTPPPPTEPPPSGAPTTAVFAALPDPTKYPLWQSALDAGVDPFDTGNDPPFPTFGKDSDNPLVAEKLVVMCWNLKIVEADIKGCYDGTWNRQTLWTMVCEHPDRGKLFTSTKASRALSKSLQDILLCGTRPGHTAVCPV
eukprot:COSAG02_NODE_7431_length_3015_cov_11.776406_4_plen_173_part_00